MDLALAARLDAVLPQTQCTRCGFPTCRDYADAIAAEARAIATLGEELASVRPRTAVVADAYTEADRRGSRLL